MSTTHGVQSGTSQESDKEPGDTITLRHPTTEDGAAIHALIDACKPLDLNSVYAYLILCEHFSSTCIVAELDGRIVGFVSGYRLPKEPSAVFVWQVAVHADGRGRGLGKRMLNALVDGEGCRGVTCMQTTITPSNESSWGLFRSFARDRGAEVKSGVLFTQSLLGGEHEEEHLLRIEPLHASA